jgi:thiol-disulfide isomerase/thioredoxin
MRPALLAAVVLWTAPATGQPIFFPNACPEVVFFAPCPAPPGPGLRPSGPARSVPASPPEHAGPPVPEERLFAEPQIGPDGTLRVYLPPKPVRDFLEHPTRDNALAYRQWNRERLEKLVAAQAVLDEISGGPPGISTPSGASRRSEAVHGSAPGRPAPTATAGSGAEETALAWPLPARQPPTPVALPPVERARDPVGPTDVLYLLATWCPYCARQTPIMAEFARVHPHVRVRGIAFDSQPETIAPYAAELPFPIRPGTDDEKAAWGVRAYPTLVILQDGRPARRITGLTSLEALEQAVGIAGGLGRDARR